MICESLTCGQERNLEAQQQVAKLQASLHEAAADRDLFLRRLQQLEADSGNDGHMCAAEAQWQKSHTAQVRAAQVRLGRFGNSCHRQHCIGAVSVCRAGSSPMHVQHIALSPDLLSCLPGHACGGSCKCWKQSWLQSPAAINSCAASWRWLPNSSAESGLQPSRQQRAMTSCSWRLMS